MQPQDIQGFFNDEGKVKLWPAKPGKKQKVAEFYASKFEFEVDYKEFEVNEIIKANSTYDDYALIRRELFGRKLLNRTPDGRKYWKVRQ